MPLRPRLGARHLRPLISFVCFVAVGMTGYESERSTLVLYEQMSKETARVLCAAISSNGRL